MLVRRPFGVPGTTLQLRDIAHGQIEISGKDGLAEVRLLLCCREMDAFPIERAKQARWVIFHGIH